MNTGQPAAPIVHVDDDSTFFAAFHEGTPIQIGSTWFHLGIEDQNLSLLGSLYLTPEAVIALAGVLDDLRDDVIAWQNRYEDDAA